MFRVDEYIQQLILSMKNVFGGRLLYVGLQGSYLRGEATENSDIDIMVIIENLSVQDLDSCTFCLTKQELLCLLDETDREIMELSMQICSNGTYDFDQAFGKLFAWCQKTMQRRILLRIADRFDILKP
jgi:predicted nucleotidyltransferase